MALLTPQARQELLRRLLQLSQSQTTSSTTADANLSLDLPGINIDLNMGSSSLPSLPSSPISMRDTLLTLLNKEVTIETSSGEDITGTLIAVKTDYVALVAAVTQNLTFVRIPRIVSVQQTSF
ncbi:DUF2642 domain-containing protein [Priestia megaterium]|uniref:DUF2642 domain-containing protein n=1 Tax=Priestia megaterium TaxID=1404 RepID=UPI0005C5E291|nr:DUF2642 domain-containing protein [Priestia megaterium]